jgi:hypothetical protein
MYVISIFKISLFYLFVSIEHKKITILIFKVLALILKNQMFDM